MENGPKCNARIPELNSVQLIPQGFILTTHEQQNDYLAYQLQRVSCASCMGDG